MSEMIEKTDLTKITKWRKYLFRMAIWLLIAGVALGAITILVADLDTVGEILGKTVGTIFLASLAMMVSVAGFRMIETGKKATQVFSLLGLGAGILAIILWALSIWVWRPMFYACVPNERACQQWVNDWNDSQRGSSYSVRYRIEDCPAYLREDCHLTWFFKLTMILTFLGLFGLIAAGIMKMYEGKKKDLIRPLKIAAVALAGYVCFYGCLAVVTGMMTGEAEFSGSVKDVMNRLGMLALFASIVWILVFLVAFVISHIEKNRDEANRKKGINGQAENGGSDASVNVDADADADANANVVSGNIGEGENQRQPIAQASGVKSDEELRAEIEEQVRREMIEKEVRERFEREQQEKMKESGWQEMEDGGQERDGGFERSEEDK